MIINPTGNDYNSFYKIDCERFSTLVANDLLFTHNRLSLVEYTPTISTDKDHGETRTFLLAHGRH